MGEGMPVSLYEAVCFEAYGVFGCANLVVASAFASRSSWTIGGATVVLPQLAAARAVKPQRAVATEAAATAALPHYSHAPRCGCPSLLRARSPRGARGRAGRSRACADGAFRDQFAFVLTRWTCVTALSPGLFLVQILLERATRPSPHGRQYPPRRRRSQAAAGRRSDAAGGRRVGGTRGTFAARGDVCACARHVVGLM